MEKTGLLTIVLMAFCLNIYGQNTIPLFLKGKTFDIVYEYNHEKGTIVTSSYIPFLLETNFNDNTFYLKRDSVTINSSMQYEYFKLSDDKWLEKKTLNKKSTSRQLKILEEVTEKDTIDWYQGYGTGVWIVQYYKLDTLSNHSIIKKEIQY